MALGGVLGLASRLWRDLSSIAVVATLAVTLVIFGSPGTSFNHVIDLTVIGFVFLVVQAIRLRVTPSFVLGVMAVLAGIAAMQNLQHWRDSTNLSRKAEMAKVVALTDGDASAAGPILSEDPLIPIVAGRRPYVLDSWMLRLIAEKDPSVMPRLTDELRARKFRAVVLLLDPERDGGRFLEERVFGRRFVAPLLENYQHVGDVGRFKVYKPKP
jgi:hypothetical protein